MVLLTNSANGWAEYAARVFEQATASNERRWSSPGEMAQAVDVATKQTAALALIDAQLVRVANGDIDKLMIFCPPQIGKSERAVRRYVEWMLDDVDPTARITVASYDKDVAVRWGRRIKQDIEETPELGITLRADSKAAGQWNTVQGGSLYCVGIRGGLSGRAVDLLIIDDPVKDRAQAESKTQRDAAWDWWENVAKVRALRTIVIQTRWHTDDLSGRMLANEPGEWTVVSIPAIAENTDDPLGREPGEELEPARERPPGYYSHLQKTTSPYVWSSLYQQRPTAAAGGIFKRDDWRYWEPFEDQGRRWLRLEQQQFDLADCSRFITIDLATSTRTSADFTVAAAWAITVSGDLVLLDRKRARVPELDHAAFIAPLRQRWLGRYDVTHIESRMFGTTLVYALGRAGVPVAELEADADKLTRALAAAGLVRQHRVWLPAGAPWLDEWLDEHADFPNVAHDDQVDVTAYAARVAIAHWLPMESAAEADARRPSADPGEIDLLTAAW
jgi:predicted phage terminase large subunit-like protein